MLTLLVVRLMLQHAFHKCRVIRSTAFCQFTTLLTHFMRTYMAAEDSDTGIKIYLREIGQSHFSPLQEIQARRENQKGDKEARALMIARTCDSSSDCARLRQPRCRCSISPEAHRLMKRSSVRSAEIWQAQHPARGGSSNRSSALANQSRRFACPCISSTRFRRCAAYRCR